MSTSTTFQVKFRRRRELKTDYRKRLAMLKGRKPRLVVRKSNNAMTIEVISYEEKGDMVNAFFTSLALKKIGWKGHTGNLPSAYLAGYACAKKALKAGVKEAVLDIGLLSPVHGSRVFASLKGAIDAGLKVPADEKVFPSAERICGKHINEQAAKDFESVKGAIDREFG